MKFDSVSDVANRSPCGEVRRVVRPSKIVLTTRPNFRTNSSTEAECVDEAACLISANIAWYDRGGVTCGAVAQKGNKPQRELCTSATSRIMSRWRVRVNFLGKGLSSSSESKKPCMKI